MNKELSPYVAPGVKNKEPYFVKCLPVDGEQIPGKWGIDLMTGEGFIYGDALKTYPEGELKENLKAQSKPAKLFLCSNDIQVGDTIINPITFEEFPNVSSGQLQFAGNFIKVIGEVSPEATWVKEGDRFDKSQIQKCIASYEQPFLGRVKYEGSSHITKAVVTPTRVGDYYIVIELKGPCGHFH